VEVIPIQKVDEEEASLEGVRPAGEPLDPKVVSVTGRMFK
jgi:hypothetical protein